MGVDFCLVGGARAQQIRRRPSGDLDPRRLLRLQSQAGRAGGEFGELGHSQPLADPDLRFFGGQLMQEPNLGYPQILFSHRI